MTTPEIRELQVFLVLVKAGNFSAAAQQMGVTQPAISGQIVKLEQTIGFPLFYRGSDGATLTVQGQAFLPLARDVVEEHTNLLRRAAFWKRSRTKQVKICSDGSRVAQEVRMSILEAGEISEPWQELKPDEDWLASLRNLEVDVVLAGSFLKSGDGPGIKTVNICQQQGVTVAWNPAYYVFNSGSFSLCDAVCSTAILPVPSMAIGFRKFLNHWCSLAYDITLDTSIECQSEADAMNACKLGLGVMIFPGDADQRMKLQQAGLQTIRTFNFLLPQGFTFGIRYRADEQNPQILATVARMVERLKIGS